MKVKKQGFTLIELLVVIAIIALLMGILMPALTRVKEAAKRAVCSSQVRQIGTGMTAYASDNDNRMPMYNSNKTKTNPYLLIHSYALYRGESDYVDASGKLLPMKLAVLYESKYIGDPKVFYCPSNINPLYKFEYYNNPKPWGTLPQYANTTGDNNQWVRMGYTYLPIDPSMPKESSTGMPKETTHTIDKLDPRIPYMTDLLRYKKDDLSHKRQNNYAVNALFSDGHVDLCSDDRVFDNKVWDQMESGAMDELPGNYIVFQLIGGRFVDYGL